MNVARRAETIEIGGWTFSWSGTLAARPSRSVTRSDSANSPAVCGVPETTPVAASIVTPAGRLPDASDHAYGPTPPATAGATRSAIPCLACFAARTDAVSGSRTARTNSREDELAPDCTLTVNL